MRFSRIAVLVALSAACCLPIFTLSSATAQERPNVLVIVTDDQRASTDTYQMLPKLMGRVRDGGLWFRNAVATIPLCCPSRVSIFTGQYAHNHGTLRNSGKGWTLQEQQRSLQFTLRSAGYKTAVAGKFLNFWSDNPPYFDRWATFTRLGYTDSTFNVDGTSVQTSQYSTAFIRDRAFDFLADFETTDETPWLMFLEPWAPHKPSTPEPKYASAPVPAFVDNPATRESDRSDKPAYVERYSVTKSSMVTLRRQMLRTLLSVDDMAAAVFDRMVALGEDNTIVVFLSDNGYLWYEHKLNEKRYPYNESARIPMFLSWPGHLPAGEVRQNIVGTIDVAPTLYELLGITPNYTVDGRSMLDSNRDHILLEYWQESHANAPPTWQAFWTPQRTYIEYPGVSGPDGREYYAPADPWQLNNRFGNTVVGDEPVDAAELAARLGQDRVCAGASCP
ncbi:MAG TPA: sulfatase [Actinomycetota bacterium]|nr:sulfatase [Actinomycetota bacterium]